MMDVLELAALAGLLGAVVVGCAAAEHWITRRKGGRRWTI